MNQDPFSQFKAAQRAGWASFSPIATFTTPAAAILVDYAGIRDSERVLDVACGTGVVAVTAARQGAVVQGLDLSPVLIDEARANAGLAGAAIEFTEGDVEFLPYEDGRFDVVLSQFGHMFAPRPEVAIAEMLRVLRPGGRIAFSTWPPELMIGAMFEIVASITGQPPGVARASDWGIPEVVRQRLGAAVTGIEFDYGDMLVPALSPRHYVQTMELSAAPVAKALALLGDDAQAVAAFRDRLAALSARFLSANRIRQTFLMTRAIKAG